MVVKMKDEQQYEALKLNNQICFPLYVCSKEVVKQYKPFLDKIDLTYTQYIAMMVMWEKKQINVKALGECLYLDSGTLTPVLKKLESKGYISRTRAKEDERNLIISVTDGGMALRDEAVKVPEQMAGCVHLEKNEVEVLYGLLHKMMKSIQ